MANMTTITGEIKHVEAALKVLALNGFTILECPELRQKNSPPERAVDYSTIYRCTKGPATAQLALLHVVRASSSGNPSDSESNNGKQAVFIPIYEGKATKKYVDEIVNILIGSRFVLEPNGNRTVFYNKTPATKGVCDVLLTGIQCSDISVKRDIYNVPYPYRLSIRRGLLVRSVVYIEVGASWNCREDTQECYCAIIDKSLFGKGELKAEIMQSFVASGWILCNAGSY